MSRQPAVSVVMPAHNAAPYIDAAIESILRQSFADFELIVRDDGSSDGTFHHLQRWARRDERIRLFRGPQLGLAGSSNWVVSKARSPLIARMDADDIARADRLERQVAVMSGNPSIVLVGSLCDVIDSSGRLLRNADFWRIVRRSWFAPFAHTSIMFRRTAFEQVGAYRPLGYCEDWDLFLRLARHGQIAVIADALVSHRVIASSSSGLDTNRHVVEQSIHDMLASLPNRDRARAHQNSRGLEPGQSPRISPTAIISSHSTLLWAGGSPKVLRELVRRGRIGADFETFAGLAWGILADASPGTLRFLLKTLSSFRNLLVRTRIKRGQVYEWEPGTGAPSLRPPSRNGLKVAPQETTTAAAADRDTLWPSL